MTLPIANRHLLERKFGRALPDNGEQKVTLTLEALSSIIDAARQEERAAKPKSSVFDDVFGSYRRGPNI